MRSRPARLLAISYSVSTIGDVRSCSATTRSSGVISRVSRTNGFASLFFGSREKISTFPGKKNFKPSVLSVWLWIPYSPCMSNIRTEPTERARIPTQTSLFRIDLPVPVRPRHDDVADRRPRELVRDVARLVDHVLDEAVEVVPRALDDDGVRDSEFLGVVELELRDEPVDHGCGDDLPDLHRKSLATLSRYSWNALRFRPSTAVRPSRTVRTSSPIRNAALRTASSYTGLSCRTVTAIRCASIRGSG